MDWGCEFGDVFAFFPATVQRERRSPPTMPGVQLSFSGSERPGLDLLLCPFKVLECVTLGFDAALPCCGASFLSVVVRYSRRILRMTQRMSSQELRSGSGCTLKPKRRNRA